MNTQLRPAIVIFLLLTVVTGVVYPLIVTGVAQAIFPHQANGSIILKDSQAVGSSLIGQEFSQGPAAASFFWGRLSATGPVAYTSFNGDKLTGSSGSNYAPTNPALIDAAKARIAALNQADATVGVSRPAGQRIPIDLVTSSGSGLDPHISPAAAEYQVFRVAKARGMDEGTLRNLLRQHTHPRQLGTLGEPTVNVLELNLALPPLK